MTSQALPTRSTQIIIWLVMLISIGMYYVVAKVAQPQGAQENPILVRVLLVMAAALVVGSFVAKSRFAAGAATAANAARIQQLRLIVALALCEAAALFGLVVWFVTGWQYFWVFLALGAAGQLLHFPGGESER